MTVFWHSTVPYVQGSRMIDQAGRFGGMNVPAHFAAGRLEDEYVAGTSGAEAGAVVSGEPTGLLVGLPNRSAFQFQYNLIYKTEQGVLGLIGGMQVAITVDGSLIDLGYCVHQVTATGQSPHSDVALAAGVWLGSTALGPGPSWKSFRITGSVKMGESGGYMRLKFRAIANGALTAPSAYLNSNSSVLLHEC